ncbi:MAG: alpha-L-fucosidase, partial [Desulfobaccales bacterium]
MKYTIALILVLVLLGMSQGQRTGSQSTPAAPQDKAAPPAGPKTFEPTWESLAQWEMPQWYEDAVFGIYWHWGPYSVAGYGYSCWYGSSMYDPDAGPDYRGGDCY